MLFQRTIYFIVKIILVFIVILSIHSCTKNMVYNQYENINNGQWHKDSIIKFSINSSDTISKRNIYINLRNNKNYEFSNLFLIVSIKFPSNYEIVDTLEYEMTSPEGRFLGTGISDIKENKLEYKTNVTFSEMGEYNISVQQAMRKSRNVDGIINLNGITDVGIEIEKVK